MSETIEIPKTQSGVDALEKRLLDLPQVEMSLIHRFAPGVYAREIFMPAGTFVIGQRHKTEHFNIVLTGRANVMMNEGEVETITAPCVLKSEAGIRKVLYILEDMRWVTIHPTDETDIQKLEDMLVSKTDAFLEHKSMQATLEKLANHQEKPDIPNQVT